MNVLLYTVDAFTNEPFKGNQAGVCILKESFETIGLETLQKIAFEMNLSETAFVTSANPADDFSKSSEFLLKWFTPTTEIDLCGHATLATAHVLFNELGNSNVKINFKTLSGVLTVSKDDSMLEMDFPANPSSKTEPNKDISAALGLEASDCLTWEYDPILANLLIEVKNDQVLKGIVPDLNKLKNFSGKLRIVGLIVTCKMSDRINDFASRYFAPWVGIDEDPVTGSSHTTLGQYWSKKLQKTTLKAIQLSNRTGNLVVLVSKERVLIRGNAITILQGSLRL